MRGTTPEGLTWIQRSPRVYRYLEKKYVAQFFESGTIRLSSFAMFQKHKDEQRGDEKDGWAIVSIPGSDFSVTTVATYGSNALLMSATLAYTEEMYQTFQVDGCFSINDTGEFGLAIARCIPGCLAGTDGPCMYTEFRQVENSPGYLTKDHFEGMPTVSFPDDTSLPLVFPEMTKEQEEKMARLLRPVQTDDGMFVKPMRFASQREWRFAWYLAMDKSAPEALTLRCPEALKFCTRIR